MQKIGDQVKQIRMALGMTQEQLAQRSGFAQSAIAEIEAGRRENMTLPTLNKLAAGLNCQFFPQLIPAKNIDTLREEQSDYVAKKIVSIASGSAAIEMQLPGKATIEKQIRELKRDLLTGRQGSLWRKI